ncbi:MAG TPA: tetratricopeptide repeat protein [Thermoanaerobaculia bacterium]|nr:tetratricopeptide repeat protein [Thermoanaerobaculia bacterium]
MNQRLTRKEIKRDEFVEALERSAGFVERNARILVASAVAAAVLVLAGLGAWLWVGSRTTKANEVLTQALETYSAPIDPAAGEAEGSEAEANADEPSFPDVATRRARAKELFQQVRDGYGMTDPADVAAVYLGQIAAEEGQPDEARRLWESFLDDHGDHILAGEVRVNLFNLSREQGRHDEVAAELEAMLAAAPDDRVLPGDVVLNELATTYEAMGRGDEARDTWQRLVEEYPQSALASAARSKAGPAAGGLLGGGGLPPGLG